jgi:hypothetical protein
MSTSARIDVEREEGWRDRARPYASGHGWAWPAGELEVVPGTHEVFLTLDWCRSPKLTVDAAGGQRAKVTCAAGGNFWMTFFDVIFRPTRYIRADVAPSG